MPAAIRSVCATSIRKHSACPRRCPPDGGYQVLDFGGFYVLIDSRDDVGTKNPEPGRMIINFDVDDARAVADQLTAAGAEWLSELEDRDGSFFATAIDPDGNYVQIIQLSEAARAEMSG
ncbi:VOC family protein [Hoyosella sp. YIM 151337]|uniref:VOC family protein n=1 Tax=Hoyosella sp. YIM 151337 TaxID=2992742 RepID=UPI0022366647|nr:VOC family protein [Hoyosella sp. YIM 151337]MCW4354279.1 VOC family protein [Hoyosella sp. YIM 151337]